MKNLEKDDEKEQKRRSEDFPEAFSRDFENQIAVMSKQWAAALSSKLFKEIDSQIMGMPIVVSDHLPDDAIYTIRRPGFDTEFRKGMDVPYTSQAVTPGPLYRYTAGLISQGFGQSVSDMSWAVNYATLSMDEFGEIMRQFPFRLRPWQTYAILAILLMSLVLLLTLMR